MANGNRVQIKSAYAYDTDTRETALICPEPTKTVQASREEADINVILDRFGITGQMPQNVRPPTFADFGDQIFDFRTAVETVAMAQDAFDSMPAKVRARFENDPQQFVEFCSNPDNLKEMRELGLAVPEKPAAVPPATGAGGGTPP